MPTATKTLFILLGATSFSRAVTWFVTDWGESPFVGVLALVPAGVVAAAWILSGLVMCLSPWSRRCELVGVPLTGFLNIAVGVASLITWTLTSMTGTTLSVTVSYIVIGIVTILLPRVTDKAELIGGE